MLFASVGVFDAGNVGFAAVRVGFRLKRRHLISPVLMYSFPVVLYAPGGLWSNYGVFCNFRGDWRFQSPSNIPEVLKNAETSSKYKVSR